jgi:hypothetical protein
MLAMFEIFKRSAENLHRFLLYGILTGLSVCPALFACSYSSVSQSDMLVEEGIYWPVGHASPWFATISVKRLHQMIFLLPALQD